MKKALLQDGRFDAWELSRTGGEISGEIPVAAMERIAGDLADASGTVVWRAVGHPDPQGRPGALLTVRGMFAMRCARCAGSVPFALEKTVPFAFVKDEAAANAIPVEDDELEIVVGSDAMSALEWIEEEVALSLPRFARHERCEAPALADDPDEDGVPEPEPRENPFAMLASLKKGGNA